MKKSLYYIVQIIWSFIVTFVIFLLALKRLVTYFNAHDTSASLTPPPGALAPAGSALLVGLIVYLILTIGYIIIGSKEVKGWRWWDVLISLALAPVSWIVLTILS